MGTSSSHGGPKGNTPSLPDDYIPGNLPTNNEPSERPDPQPKPYNPDEEEDNLKKNLWKNVKTQFAKVASGSSNNYKAALSSYVNAYGGAKKAAISATSGKSTTIKLGSFLSSISSIGIADTLNKYNIEYEGKSAKEVLSDLVNKIAPVPETKEDSVALSALTSAIEELYVEIAENNEELTVLDNLNENTFNRIMETYICSYIYERLLKDLESRFEINMKDSKAALKKEQEIKDYIDGDVENNLKKINLAKLNYNNKSINKIIDDIYFSCYSVIEESI